MDRRTPVAAKLIAPLAAAIAFAAGYVLVAIPSLEGVLQRAAGMEARDVAALVQTEYETYHDDRAALDAFLQNLVRFDPTVRHVHVYRVVSGSPVLWAASDPAPRADHVPGPHDLEPLTTGASAQQVETVAGVRLIETTSALRVDGRIDAAVGVYASLDALDAVTDVLQTMLLVAAVGTVVLYLAVAATLEVVVLRPIGRLHRAALRVAAGDLGVRLPEGDLPPARDEIMDVAREFDRMVRIVAAQRADIERQAATDSLTSLLNRRSFDDRLGTEVDRAVRLRYPLAVSLVDLDGFKKLNDSQGHLAGDAALRSVAAALAGAVRGSDVLARFGGDEFAVVQPGCDHGSAAVVGVRLRAAVEALAIAVGAGTGQVLSASVGVATLRSGDGVVDLLARADAALYGAKARGGGVEVAPDARR